MSGNLFLRIGVLLLGLFVAVMTIFEVLTDYRNNLSAFFRYVTVGAFLVGFVNPRVGIYLLLFTCAYLDICKRFLVYFGRVYFDDVFIVLSVAPLLFAGICSGLLVGRFLSRRMLSGYEWGLFGIVVLVELLVMTKVAAHGIREVHLAVYVPMLLFAGMLIPSCTQQRRYIRAMLLVFIPVAVYGMTQAVYGFNTMELTYMATGLTVVRDGLLDPYGAIRAFSTLSSAHAFAGMMAILFTYSLYEAVYARRARYIFWLLCVVYLGALACSLVRTYWIMAAVMPICFIAFRDRSLTKAFYVLAIMAAGVIVLSAGWLLDNMHRFALGENTSSTWVQRALTLGTYGERLQGFENWFNPKMWTLFGMRGQHSAEEGLGAHDVVAGTLLAYGAAGLLVLLALVSFGLYFAHGRVLAIRDREERGLYVCYLSIVFLFIASGTGSGGSFHVYPLNYMFWFASGCLAVILFRTAKSTGPEAESMSQSGSTPVPAAVVAGDARALGAGRVVVGRQEAGHRGFPFKASGRVARPDFGPFGGQGEVVGGDCGAPHDGGGRRFRPTAGRPYPPRVGGAPESPGLS